jgi:ATP-dependent RNA helicase DHX8/PRP22
MWPNCAIPTLPYSRRPQNDVLRRPLYQLEFLSLVAKITQELENHVGISDKTLAEFVIDLHDKSTALADFTGRLTAVGASLPESFVQNLDRLILRMHLRFKKKIKQKMDKGEDAVEQPATSKDPNDDRELENQRRMFPGLAKPNQDPGQLSSKDVLMKEVDDMMSQFEHAVKKSKSRARLLDERDDGVGAGDEPPSKRRRRSSASPPRDARNGERRNGRDTYSRRPHMDDRPYCTRYTMERWPVPRISGLL